MKVINVDQNGNEIDLTKIVIPLNSAAYDVCKEVYIRGEHDRHSNKGTEQES